MEGGEEAGVVEVTGELDGGFAAFIGVFELVGIFDEEGDGRGVDRRDAGGDVEEGFAVGELVLGISAGFEEQLDEFKVVVRGGEGAEERGFAAGVDGVGVGTGVEEDLDEVGVADGGGFVESGVAVDIDFADGGRGMGEGGAEAVGIFGGDEVEDGGDGLDLAGMIPPGDAGGEGEKAADEEGFFLISDGGIFEILVSHGRISKKRNGCQKEIEAAISDRRTTIGTSRCD
jgi:hypothetical protein